MPVFLDDVGRGAELDVDEASVPREVAERHAVEPQVMDPLGIGAVERAVLGVEVGDCDPATRHEETAEAASAIAVSATWCSTRSEIARSKARLMAARTSGRTGWR